MMTLRQFTATPPAVPMSTTWYLTDLGEAKGKQDLFTRQSPQRLKALREHAMIESAVSSNRIEGVEIDASRVRAVVLGKLTLRDRNEEEVRGYRDAGRKERNRCARRSTRDGGFQHRRSPAGMSGRQRRHDPPRAQGPEETRGRRMPGPRPSRPMATHTTANQVRSN